MKEINKTLSIVQNFVCTSKHRKKMIIDNLPKMAKIFSDAKFYISYNTKENLDEIKSAYAKNIKNLYFEHSETRDWGLKTKELVEKVKTPYVLYICEDFDYLCEKQDWDDTLDEVLLKNKVDFVMMAKIEKYSNVNSKWINYYDRIENNAMYYNGLKSPSTVLSIDAIYRKSFLLERLREYTGKYCHHLPNNYETYYKNENGIRRFNIKCAIPRKLLLYSHHPEGDREAKFKDMNSSSPIGTKQDLTKNEHTSK